MLTTFVQPDGGGGNFGAAVAGTQNTALIGAPVPTWARATPGAAYLFDADPSSPTFGNAIAAVQEPTPTSGDAFGTAVGFDDGALIVGAAGAIGSGVTGAEAVDLYQPGASISVSSTTTYATAAYDSVILSGTFMDANPSAALTATINWGDGSAATVVDLPGGVLRLRRPARLHDRPGLRVVHYRRDPERRLRQDGVRADDVAISNPAPAFASPGLVSFVDPASSKGARSMSAGRSSAPAEPTPTRSRINWGDGSAATTIVLPPGQDTFSTSHTYLNNPPGVGSENLFDHRDP